MYIDLNLSELFKLLICQFDFKLQPLNQIINGIIWSILDLYIAMSADFFSFLGNNFNLGTFKKVLKIK